MRERSPVRMAMPSSILRGSGKKRSALDRSKELEEKVPGRGTKSLTAIEKARLKK